MTRLLWLSHIYHEVTGIMSLTAFDMLINILFVCLIIRTGVKY